MIHPILDSPPLTTLNLATSLSMYPSRPPSPYIPRYTSFAFHPMEMLYAVGQPDGSGASNVLFIEQPLTTFVFSQDHWMQTHLEKTYLCTPSYRIASAWISFSLQVFKRTGSSCISCYTVCIIQFSSATWMVMSSCCLRATPMSSFHPL